MNPRHRIESPVSPKVQATVLFLSLCLAHPAESIITPAPPAVLNSNHETAIGDRFPRVVNDGQGVWICIWTSSDSLVETIGRDDDILFARSMDNGATWTEAAPLNTNAPTDSRSDWYPQAAADGKGNWVVVWESVDSLVRPNFIDSRILLAQSNDHGATWSDPVLISDETGAEKLRDQSPHVSTDGGGNWIVVWQSENSLGGTIGSDHDILSIRSTDNGVTWTKPAPLNSNAESDMYSDFECQVTPDGFGNWLAVWRSTDSLNDTIGSDSDILFARSFDNGANWSRPQPLNTNASFDSAGDAQPRAATGGDGTWVVVWTSGSYGGLYDSYRDVLYARSTDNGETWTDPVNLNNKIADFEGGEASPQVVTDGAGNWIASWVIWKYVWFLSAGYGPLQFVCSTDAGDTWTNPAPLNTIPRSNTFYEGDRSPSITTDRTGNWVAAWESKAQPGNPSNNDHDILYTTFFLDPAPPVRSFDVVKDGSVDSKDLLVWLSRVIKGEEEHSLLFEFALHWDSVVGPGEP